MTEYKGRRDFNHVRITWNQREFSFRFGHSWTEASLHVCMGSTKEITHVVRKLVIYADILPK
jgi:beta-xylosidase